MFPEYREEKEALVGALEKVGDNVAGCVSVYALLETDDPAFPFELKWVHKPGNVTADSVLVNQRLFDRAFLDYGYHEVRSEESPEGVEYVPLADMRSEKGRVGAAPVDFFDVDRSRARMASAAGEEDDGEGDASAMRFVSFLNKVDECVLNGDTDEKVGYEDVVRCKGLVFKYDGPGGAVIAFQRVQPMWVSKKSSLLLFGRDSDVEMFADRSIKVGTAFDFVLFRERLYFLNMKALETLFAYRKLIVQQAKDYADTLEGIVADYEKLDERIAQSSAVANRLVKIQDGDSPVPDMDAEEIEYALNRIPYYSRKLKLNEDGKLMITTNVEVSDFLRLLDDDFVVSPLSNAQYETRSKKRLDNPQD